MRSVYDNFINHQQKIPNYFQKRLIRRKASISGPQLLTQNVGYMSGDGRLLGLG